VTHALNIHRQDVLSDLRSRKVVKKSVSDFKTDVRALYLAKVKTIYGEIIRFATRTQSDHLLTDAQNRRISQIKVANRRMVEIIRDVTDLNRNVSRFLESDNLHVKKQYNNFRRIVVKALRVIYYKTEETDLEQYLKELQELEKSTHERMEQGNIEIDALIRKDEITTDMASSLVNDQDHVEDLVEKLILVAQLLYISKDPLAVNSLDLPEVHLTHSA
jgi:phosphate:Na+ symporter